MKESSPIARDQFFNDIMLVLENTYSAHETIMKVGRELLATDAGTQASINAVDLSYFIQDLVESSIMSKVSKNYDLGDLLIAQICLGWGIDPYYQIAEYYMGLVVDELKV